MTFECCNTQKDYITLFLVCQLEHQKHTVGNTTGTLSSACAGLPGAPAHALDSVFSVCYNVLITSQRGEIVAAKTRKINSTLPSDLIDRMDAYGKKSGLTRSGLIFVAVKQYLDAQEIMPDVNEALQTLSKIADVAMEMSREDLTKQVGELEAKVDDLETRLREANMPVVDLR